MQILSTLQKRRQTRYVSPYDLAIIFLGLGDRARAFTLLGEALDERSFSAPYLNVDPIWDGVRSDPQFQTLAGRLRQP